jgi:hypothetical protein
MTVQGAWQRRRAVPFWAQAADVVAIALLALAAYIAVSGGFVLHPAGLRLSLRSAGRVLSWGAAILVVRHMVVRRPAIHERFASGVRAIGSAQRDLPLDDVMVATRGGAAGRRGAWLAGIGVIALYAALTLVMTYPQVRVMDSGVSPDIGDPLFSTWRVSWFAHQLPRDPLHLFDANIFYPERDTLAFSDAMIVPSLMIAPLLWMGAPPLLACNILLLSGFALSGGGMFLLVRSLTRSTGAALVAGFIFAFLPYRYMHYAHLELQMAMWMPMCLWALHRTAAWGRLRDGLLTGGFFALQTLSCIYYGIFFATWLVPVGVAVLLGGPRARLWPATRALAAGVVLAAAIVLPFARPYLAARRAVGERPVSEVEFYSATPGNYLVAHPRNALFGPLSAGRGEQERELFMGVAVPVLAVAGLWPPVSAARIGYAVALAAAFELSLGFNGLAYPWVRELVLPYRGLRVPARMAMLVGLSLAILAGYGVARICRLPKTRAARAFVVAAIAGVVFMEYRSTLVLKRVWTSPPPVYSTIANRPSAVLLELPLVVPDVALEPIYMYFSTFHWHRLVNGYSGFSPPSYGKLLDAIASFPDDRSIAELRRRHVDLIVVHGAFYSPDDYDALVERIARRRDLELESVTRWRGRDTRLYRLVAERTAAAVHR